MKGSDRMKRKTKWILTSIFIALLILLGIQRYYVYTMEDYWNEKDAAVIVAKQQANLASLTHASKSVWDTVCWVIEGKNTAGEDTVVWIVDGKVDHQELAKNGVSLDQIKNSIKSQMPDISIVRLVPGIFDQGAGKQYVYQLFYKEGDHYNYKFYRFSDGQALPDTYTLPNR